MAIYVVGIDPGVSGGVALIVHDMDHTRVAVYGMPTRLAGKGSRRCVDVPALRDLVINWQGKPTLVVTEMPQARPRRPGKGGGEQHQGESVVSTMTSMRNFGRLEGLCEALDWPTTVVSSRTWKAVVLHGTAKDKAAAIAYCTARYPGVSLCKPRGHVPQDGMADALCMADYGLRLAKPGQA